MKVLVTGATGFVGSWVARSLIEHGHSVRALVRERSKLTNLEDLEVERVVGDVVDPPSLEGAFDGCEAVVHTAGVAHFAPDTRTMYRVNVDGVQNVLGAALEAGVKRAVMTSSVASMGGNRRAITADESSPSQAESSGIDYFISKHRGERAALALADRGLHVTVVRPSVALGPGDIYHSSTTTFLALAKGQLRVYVNGGSSFCDVRDVALAHVRALEVGGAGAVYITAGHNLEIWDMVGRVAALTGTRPPRRVPYQVALMAAGAIELASKVTRKHPALTRQLVKASRLYTFVSSEKAERELGYEIRDLDTSLRDTFRYFLEVGRLKATTPELEAIAEGA